MLKPLIAIAGPTASGKTDVVLEMSRHLPLEAISCDSMQVYKRMPILTQVPAPETQKKIPTHLVSFLEPEEEYNASLFRQAAQEIARTITGRKKIPVIVGGTGLYLRALLNGLFDAPSGISDKNEALRQELLAEEVRLGPGHLHQKLSSCDPSSAAKIHSRDLRRLVRALEVFILTGKPISEQKKNRKGIRADYATRLFFLNRNRADLYERINRRVEKMFKEGVVGEAQALEGRVLSQTAQMALGLREVQAYLKKERTLEETKELIKKNTRNYAKRQLSWFRHEEGAEMVTIEKNDTPVIIASRILDAWESSQ